MNTRRLLISIIVVFVAITVTDILIHGVWLSSRYGETNELWRPEDEMSSGKYMGWLHAGHALAAITFTILWAAGFAAPAAKISSAVKFGLCMALFSQAHTLITYGVQPVPLDIIGKWFLGGIVQGIILGVVVFYTYKPREARRPEVP
jgi:hypothetical protein